MRPQDYNTFYNCKNLYPRVTRFDSYDFDHMPSGYLHGSYPEAIFTSSAKIWGGIFILLIAGLVILATHQSVQAPEPTATPQVVKIAACE